MSDPFLFYSRRHLKIGRGVSAVLSNVPLMFLLDASGWAALALFVCWGAAFILFIGFVEADAVTRFMRKNMNTGTRIISEWEGVVGAPRQRLKKIQIIPDDGDAA